ncbi:50S ribosomal protein L30 [Hydrogenobaculum acidophilum]
MKLKIVLKRGLAGKDKAKKEAVRSLGLKKVGESVILEKNPMVCGNLEKVKHLVCVEEIE